MSVKEKGNRPLRDYDYWQEKYEKAEVGNKEYALLIEKSKSTEKNDREERKVVWRVIVKHAKKNDNKAWDLIDKICKRYIINNLMIKYVSLYENGNDFFDDIYGYARKKALENIHIFDEDRSDKFLSYLWTVAKNKASDLCRHESVQLKKRNHIGHYLIDLGHGNINKNPLEKLIIEEEVKKIKRVVNNVQDNLDHKDAVILEWILRDRTLWNLIYGDEENNFEKKKVKDLAGEVGLSEKQTYNRMNKIKNMIIDELKKTA